MRVTEYRSDCEKYSIRLVNPYKNLWGVFHGTNLRLNKTDAFNYIPMPSNRSDKWINEHSFTFDEAKSILKDIEQKLKGEK